MRPQTEPKKPVGHAKPARPRRGKVRLVSGAVIAGPFAWIPAKPLALVA